MINYQKYAILHLFEKCELCHKDIHEDPVTIYENGKKKCWHVNCYNATSPVKIYEDEDETERD